MDFIPENPIFRYNSDTLSYVRKQYDLDNPEKLKDSIDSLSAWIQEQDHFVKKDYSKEFLERAIIISKGSVEMAKKRFDFISTFKTLLPKYYEPFDMDNSYIFKIVHCSFLPKMAEDHSRVFMLKNLGQRYDPGVLDFFKYIIMVHEYSSAHDYANGFTGIFDYTENNIEELSKAMNYVEFQQTMTMILEGYNIKVNGIHFLSASKYIDGFIRNLKNVLSPHIGELIHLHSSVETLYKYVPKDIMPIEYGGKEKPLKELSDNLLQVMKSDEFMTYFNEARRATTDEALRSKDTYSDHYKGIPGSLKIFSSV